jgi:hypothetical protein
LPSVRVVVTSSQPIPDTAVADAVQDAGYQVVI